MSSSINAHDLGRVVRVEYDYQYKANDGRMVKITEGEEFVLIKKSNVDWWQVVAKDHKKPLYVPAAYVKEQQQKRFPDHPFFKKAHHALLKSQKKEGNKESGKGKKHAHRERLSDGPSGKERMIVVTGSREDLNVFSGFSNSMKFSELRASTDSLDKFIENENPYDVVPVEPLARPEEKKTKRPELKPGMFEEPDYANLSDFSSGAAIAEKKHQRTDSDNAGAQIEPKRGSGGKNPPAVLKKPSFRRPDLIDSSDKTPEYANLQDQAIKPAIPTHHSPQSSTTVEVLADGWELQLDNETGSKYYYNPATGSMRAKPPRHSGKNRENATTQQLEVPERGDSPDLVPMVQPKTAAKTDAKRSMRPSPLQRRKTSPARFKNPQKAPFIKRVEKKKPNDENVSPNENNSNNFFSGHTVTGTAHDSTAQSQEPGRSSPVLGHTEKGTSHSRASSGTSRSLSPDGALSSAVPNPHSSAPTPAGWAKERGSDGDTILVNNVNGDRWIQFFDTNSGSFYYCNEHTRVTVWELPTIENTSLSNETAEDNWSSSQPNSPETKSRHNRTSSSPLGSPSAMREGKKSSIRKSKTLDRDSYQSVNDGEFADSKSKSSSLPWPKKKTVKNPPMPPSANLKPRSGRAQDKHPSKRMLHTQSMIIIDSDTHSGVHHQIGPFSSSPYLTKADEQNEMIERQGRLNWTKLAEAGKKTRKNWSQQWVVLLSNNLLFYKDQKQAMMTKANPLGKPDSSCELRGATVEWAKEKSSKKNVFEVRTVRGFCFLLQHDDVITIREWYKSIEATIKRANQVEPLDHSLLTRKDSRGSTEDENMENTHVDTKDKKKKEKKKDKKGKPPSRHGSDAKQSDKVRTKLKKFIGRRPTMESLQERGLIQESVFGCPLHKLCDKDGSNVPKFVRLCVEEVERRGLGVDGIYRVSGNLSHVQKLRYNIDRDVPVNLEDNEWEDIHVITGALKMFLRELPEPVIPFNFFDKFIATCQISDITARIDATRSLIRALPKPNNETLKYLMQHFVKVVSFSESNRMQVQNVAIVFGPTLLLKPPEMTNHHDPGGGHMAVYMMYQNQIVDYMLTEYKQLF